MPIAQVDAAKFDADGLAHNLLDWYDIQLIKEIEGRYGASGLFDAQALAHQWRMPVVTTTAMAQ